MNQRHAVVVGYGLAGGLAAIELADAGFKVTLLEKMPMPGGVSIMAGGGFRGTKDPEMSFQYLKHTNGGTTPDSVLRSFANSMAKVKDRALELAKVNGSVLDFWGSEDRDAVSNHYGYPGYDSFIQCRITDVPDVDLKTKWKHVINGRGWEGIRLFNMIYDNVEARQNITTHLDTPMLGLITEGEKVVGVKTKLGEHRAEAVVLACGGFENNDDMKQQFFQGRPVYAHGHWGNTGDGIKAAQKAGADIWHMWHYHGSYGFKHPEGFAIRVHGGEAWRPTDPQPPRRYEAKKLYHIVVDKNGRRFMNEHMPYATDMGHRPMELWSGEEIRYPRIPAYFISDENGRLAGPWGTVRMNDVRANDSYKWSDNNTKEIENGMFKKFDTLSEVAEHIGCDPAVLVATFHRYNNVTCIEGDAVYGRPKFSLFPVRKAPFYVAEVWPVVGNTQGGPRKNEHFQVIDPYGKPIQGLYTSGECGSIWGHVYMGSGNLSECFVGADLITQHLTKTNFSI